MFLCSLGLWKQSLVGTTSDSLVVHDLLQDGRLSLLSCQSLCICIHASLDHSSHLFGTRIEIIE